MKKTITATENMSEKTAVKHDENPAAALFERRVVETSEAEKMAARASDYNDRGSERNNFNTLSFKDLCLKDEDLSRIEAHYSKFENCTFENVKFAGAEFHFAALSSCTFSHCDFSNAEFSFAEMNDVRFLDSDLSGIELPFAHGNISCTNCMMRRTQLNNALLKIEMKQCDAFGFEGNFSRLDLAVEDSNLRRAEFNDELAVGGTILRTDLTGAELNRCDLSNLVLTDCATRNMETEDSIGLDDSSSEVDFDGLFEDEEDK